MQAKVTCEKGGGDLMYDFTDYKPEKIYGDVRQGWHNGRIHRGELRNARSKQKKEYKYIKIDFEILDEGVLVPGFFFHNHDQEKPDALLGKMCYSVGLNRDYRNDPNGFFRALIGSELMVKVAHRYKQIGNSRVRRERAVDFEPLSQEYDHDEYEAFDGESEEEMAKDSNSNLSDKDSGPLF
jgi:hypothetical protein